MDEGLNMENPSTQKFCLKWNNFHNNFISQFEALKEDEDFVDVTIYCDGQSIKAHKVVLSASSPYLKSIFKDNPCKHPVIILDNLSFNNLEAVIQFIYSGQVYIEQHELSSFLKAAETLQIKGFTEASNNQSLIDSNMFPEQENDSSVVSRKREGDVDSEFKKLRSKKVPRRTSNNGPKENSTELYEDQKIKTEKDWFDGGNKSDRNSESTSANVSSEEQMLENDEKLFTSSIGDEDYTPGELKRPHWLDPRSCPLCNRVYSNLSNLRQHMKLIHNPTLVTCKLCFRTFKTDLYLRRHLISFHEINANINGNNVVSIEPYKPAAQSTQPSDWNPNVVKLEPNNFQEMFNTEAVYQVPQ